MTVDNKCCGRRCQNKVIEIYSWWGLWSCAPFNKAVSFLFDDCVLLCLFFLVVSFLKWWVFEGVSHVLGWKHLFQKEEIATARDFEIHTCTVCLRAEIDAWEWGEGIEEVCSSRQVKVKWEIPCKLLQGSGTDFCCERNSSLRVASLMWLYVVNRAWVGGKIRTEASHSNQMWKMVVGCTRTIAVRHLKCHNTVRHIYER